jgi:hypothetical protein
MTWRCKARGCLEGETAESIRAFSTLFRERALPDLGRNIQCGNSLVGTEIMKTDTWKEMAEDERQRINPFDFDRGFPQVFKQGGFDTAIGNPPYGAFASDLEAIFLRERYETVSNSLDTFIMFVEQAGNLLREGGKVGMIVPSGWVSTPSSRPLRDYFLSIFKAESFVSLPFDVFKGAYIDTVIFTAAKLESGSSSAGPSGLSLVVFPHRYKVAGAADFEAYKAEGDTASWFRAADHEFLITLPSAAAAILDKVRKQPAKVGDFVDVMRGIETYTLKASRSGLSNPKYAFDGVLQRYVIKHGEIQYLDYSPEIEGSKPWRFFSEKRILVRQVLSRKLRLQATMTSEAFLSNQSVQSLVRKSRGVECEWLLAILNSKLLSWYFVSLNGAARRDDFPKIIIKQTRELPVPQADNRSRSRLSKLAEQMLSLQATVEAAKSPGETERLRRQIDATDRQIDSLVYKLYDLADAEIRMIEEANAEPLAD